MTTQTEMAALEGACLELEVAKEMEAQATATRIHAEQRLLALGVALRPEGSVTTIIRDWKIVTTGRVNRNIDDAVLDAIRADVPSALFDRAIRYKPSLVLDGLRYLQNNEPDTYAVLAQAITAKPGKPSVTIERVEPACAAA